MDRGSRRQDLTGQEQPNIEFPTSSHYQSNIPVSYIIGQTVEMDAYTGSPQLWPIFAWSMHFWDSECDFTRLVGLQQRQQLQKHREALMIVTSVYISQE